MTTGLELKGAPMKTRKLGASGPAVGAVGFGAMSFAGFYGATDEATSHRTLARAAELGVTHIDTARIYGLGRSEEYIASYLKANPSHPFVIATKGGIYRSPDGARHFDNSPIALREHLEGCLYRLGLEHVPLFYIHRRDQRIPIEDVMGTLMRFKEEGKIGGIGFSEISPSSLRRAAAVGPVMAVQSEYSLWTRLPELGMIQACKDVGAAFIPFSPVARGMLGDTPIEIAALGDSDFRRGNPRFTSPNFEANLVYIDAFRSLARDLGTKTATLAIAWVLDQGDHLIPIPGTRTPDHLEELAAADSFQMTDEIRTEISRVLPAGFAHGDRYTDAQIIGIERYC